MKKFIHVALLGTSLVFGNALAAPIYLQADNVEGLGVITYDIIGPVYDAPEFTYQVTSGSLSHNLGDFTPGDYTIDFSLDGFWVDIDNDHVVDETLANFSYSTDAISLSSLPPLSGSYGAFSWDFDTVANSVFLSYDFGDMGLTNAEVNAFLAAVDLQASNSMNGTMDAYMGWESMRIELNPVAVPEPSLWLLGGLGLIGFGMARRQRRLIES